MKKLCIILAVILCVILGGCKKQENTPDSESTTVAVSQTTSAQTAESSTESAELSVSVTEKQPEPVASIENLEEPLGTEDVLGEEGEYAASFIFKTNQDIKNFRFFKVDMTYNEESNSLSGTVSKEYGFREILKAENGIVLVGETGETMPFLALSYESLNGKSYTYAIEISGEDGHPLLTPFDLTNPVLE